MKKCNNPLAAALLLPAFAFFSPAGAAPAADVTAVPLLRADSRGVDFAGVGLSWRWDFRSGPRAGAARDRPGTAPARPLRTAFREYRTPRRILGGAYAAAGGVDDTPAAVASTEAPAPQTFWGAVGDHFRRNAGKYTASLGAAALSAGVYALAANQDGGGGRSEHTGGDRITVERNYAPVIVKPVTVTTEAAAPAAP